jgi:hypothetical protein
MKIDPTWQVLQPGLYADKNGTLHIDAVRYLMHCGYVPSEKNQDTLIRAFQNMKCGPRVRVEIDGKEQP